ncbi:MAG: (E)-4-hydroxy-3-methylbut-2-enyl-diphosphate synthase [Bacteroidetes bacterium]|nr:(E)-4-hydroxy-3-methylbut-2-enyl-diphosphate synthase [Bacteroidota bacterium]
MTDTITETPVKNNRTSKSANHLEYPEQSAIRYSRRKTREVFIGDVPLGAENPIRVQSMTITDTMDTIGTVEQAIRMVDAGCEYVRITAPSLNEAKNLENIKKELHKRGYKVPLIADIHFTPNAAELAAGIVEKVRVNPGNYADKKKFENIEYSDDSYRAELERIRECFSPLVKICKKYGTAMRIGTNHGSLSDRIMSRYGDTPLGMVESALEFVRICEDLGYYDIVLSMKASNSIVMVQAYRLLVKKLDEEGFKPYPLHLGVTEAGEGEDGRIKSAVGIGTLLEDGLGDTIRVSLTEEPEVEIPVAKMLANRITLPAGRAKSMAQFTPSIQDNPEYETRNPINPFEYSKRDTNEVLNIGKGNVPVVVADFSRVENIEYSDLQSAGYTYSFETDKWHTSDIGCDYIYSGNKKIPIMLPAGLKEILNYSTWLSVDDKTNIYPLYTVDQYLKTNLISRDPKLNFIRIKIDDLDADLLLNIKFDRTAVIVLDTDEVHAMLEQRKVFFKFMKNDIKAPVIILRKYANENDEQLLLYAATDIGGLLIDGLGDGVWFAADEHVEQQRNPDSVGVDPDYDGARPLQEIKKINRISFGILQAARTRISKPEYISCPSCGRTLFDLQEVTAMIRIRTNHLKGVKIGIMGCIVNGPGEMADADYGYVGSGKDIITLYRGKEVVKRNIPTENAVDELITLIKEDGNWVEPF